MNKKNKNMFLYIHKNIKKNVFTICALYAVRIQTYRNVSNNVRVSVIICANRLPEDIMCERRVKEILKKKLRF